MTSGTPGAVTYRVTGTVPAIQVGYDNRPVHGTTFTYSAGDVYAGSVFLPAAQAGDTAAVHAAIAADLGAVLTALALSGTVRR